LVSAGAAGKARRRIAFSLNAAGRARKMLDMSAVTHWLCPNLQVNNWLPNRARMDHMADRVDRLAEQPPIALTPPIGGMKKARAC